MPKSYSPLRKAKAREEIQARESTKPRLQYPENTQVIPIDPLIWLQQYTKTKDSHWREHGATSAYRPFPDKPYFRAIVQAFQEEPVLFIEKSRDMMISWLIVGLFTHAVMTTEGIEVIFQSQKEDKAAELIDYAKCLYEHQPQELKSACPLATKMASQSRLELKFAHGGRLLGIPGGADQIRSYHPWGLFADEAAFQPEAGDCYEHAVPVCQKIIEVSTIWPGWFTDVVSDNTYGLRVMRVHYSADPDRDPQINPAWYKQERAKYTSQGAWDREQEIIHDAGGGERIFVETLVKHWSKIVLEDGFEIPPQWRRIGGADHGKANPTAFLQAAIDYDGNLYICAEYYQPGLSPDQHLDFLWQEWPELFDIPEIYADPSIFFKTQAQAKGGFKAISELYAEEREITSPARTAGAFADRTAEPALRFSPKGAPACAPTLRPGLTNLISAPDNTEILGMERILKHWHDLDHREPSLKIICPRRYDTGKKRYGLHRDGCPNLIWELRRARREELSATQLQNRNPSEKIVDRDNHLRDCLKYIVLSLPDPTTKSREDQAAELVRGLDATSAMIRYQQFMERETTPQPPALGRRRLRWGR